MQGSKLFVPLKVVGYLVLLSLLAALGYSLSVALMHWSGIAV